MTTPIRDAEAPLLRAAVLVCEASDRGYTDAELEEVMFCLMLSITRFKKIPGGKEVMKRVVASIELEQERRRATVDL